MIIKIIFFIIIVIISIILFNLIKNINYNNLLTISAKNKQLINKNHNKLNINIILYSNNEPFNTTKKLIIKSIQNYSNNNIIIHNYNLKKIKNCKWFKKIKDLPYIFKNGRRDGYYNCWKPFIVKEVYNKINKNDIIYYVDCSQYYIDGFTQNIDKLCSIAFSNNFIAGSCGNYINNDTIGCCNNLLIWNKIIFNNNNKNYLDKKHVLNSWFILKKCNENNDFINDWVYYCLYKDKQIKYPMITYHHTVDQSIFNILVYKYKQLVFFNKNISHNRNKDKNLVLKIINNSENINDYFIYLN
jgi:hypothetical protein